MKTIILISLIFLKVTTYSQDHSGIVGKKWYAVKVFTGGPAMPKETELAPEEDCSSFTNGRHYFFYMDLKHRGTITTDFKFSSSRRPIQYVLNGDELTMRFSNQIDDDMNFQIIESTEDFLQITGPNNKTYFLISDRALQ